MGQKNQRRKNDTIDELTKSPLRVLPATVPERTHALHIGQVIPVMILWRAATVSFLERRGDTSHAPFLHRVMPRGRGG